MMLDRTPATLSLLVTFFPLLSNFSLLIGRRLTITSFVLPGGMARPVNHRSNADNVLQDKLLNLANDR
jgi:hypothetical protein